MSDAEDVSRAGVALPPSDQELFGSANAAASGRRWLRSDSRGAALLTRGTDLARQIGTAALFALLLVIPSFNPAVYRPGYERVYLGMVLVLVAALCGLLQVRSPRFDWVIVGLVLAILYVLEVAVLRGVRGVGLLANAYRPLQPAVVFSSCALLLRRGNFRTAQRLFLWGGLIGSILALANTLVPHFDPFALSRPTDLPIQVSYFIGHLRRQSGAFVYPNNFGTYCAYLAIVALVLIERGDARLASLNLHTAAMVSGTLGVVVSGSRSAALGLLLGVGVVIVRTPGLRRTLLLGGAIGGIALTIVAAIAGVLDRVVTSRFVLAGDSLSLRLDAWRPAWHAFTKSPLSGAGVIPYTIDSTFFYLLYVGGLFGLLLMAAIHLTTTFRPLVMRYWSPLPLLAAVAGASVFEDSLGQPLANWAIGAGFFLLSAEWLATAGAVKPERSDAVISGYPRGSGVRLRDWRRLRADGLRPKLVILGGAALLGLGLMVGTGELRHLPNTVPNPDQPPSIAATRIVSLPASSLLNLSAPERGLFMTSDADGHSNGVWTVDASGRLRRFRISPQSLQVTTSVGPRLFTPSQARANNLVGVNVAAWQARTADAAVVTERHGQAVRVRVVSLGHPVRVLASASIPLKRAPSAIATAVATWSGPRPDLYLFERSQSGSWTVAVYSGESQFRRQLFKSVLPRTLVARNAAFAVAHFGSSKPSLLVIDPGVGAETLLHLGRGDTAFDAWVLNQPLAGPPRSDLDHRFLAAPWGRSKALFVADLSRARPRISIFPLPLSCDPSPPHFCAVLPG
jgi:hypothetical protein